MVDFKSYFVTLKTSWVNRLINGKEVIKSWNFTGGRGGQTKQLDTFVDIRKQVMWGNKFIKFGKITNIFENWIRSDLIYINDILDDKMSLSEIYILNKLKFKINCFAEFHILKKSIPAEWIQIVQKENYVE